MPWKNVTDEKENKHYNCFRMEILIRDDDLIQLGSVMQFYMMGACYAIGPKGRLGPFTTFNQAKAAVEKDLECA